MTTIVYDTKSLVSDSQSTAGDQIYEEDCQKLFPNVGPFAILGVAGNYQDALDIIDTIKHYTLIEQIRGLDYKELGWSCAMLAVTHDGQPWHYTGNRSFELRPDLPFAIGSGADYALGALAMGASGEEAVKVAARYDPYTNGVTQVANFQTEEEDEEENTEGA